MYEDEDVKRSVQSPDVRWLFEMGSLRRVQRTWNQFGDLSYANVAEHTLRVAWLGMLIAMREGADVGRTVQMAMIHDIPEIRTGDVNYLSRMYVQSNEDLALRDMIDGTTVEELISALWAEYHERSSLESKIVKDADTLDCDLELAESRVTGPSLYPVLKATRAEAMKKLHTRTAIDLYHEIYATAAHEWHTLGRNRVTAGDWRPVE